MQKNRMALIRKTVASLLIAAMVCPYAYAADVGKATYVQGRVDVLRSGSDSYAQLKDGDPISVGDSVRTKANSKAEVTFADNSTIRLAQNSKVAVKDYVVDSANKRKTAEIALERGRVRTIIAKMPDKSEFNISTPNARGTVKGSDVFASYQAGSSGMLVAEGRLSVVNMANPGKAIVVPEGNSVYIPMDETLQGPRTYYELEKKMQEQETDIPKTPSRDPESTAVKGFIAKVSGDVRITPKGGVSRKAAINDVIGEGDTVETGKDGIVNISFDNGNGIDLKPDTSVYITRLSINPRTGQYENKFDAAFGKVRARIESLKETNSTFEIKTPTAICGARGTLMYLEIGAKSTRFFFEGGFGDLVSAISSTHRQIEMGKACYADSDGNVSEPYIPSEEERLGWTSEWGAGNGTEGYSHPEAAGVFLHDGKPTGLIEEPATATQLQTFFDDPIFGIGDGTGDEGGGEVPPVVEETLTSSGSFYGDSRYYGSSNGNIDGLIGITGTFWNGSTAEIASAGSYESYGYSPFVWFGADNYEEYAFVEGQVPSEGFAYSYNPDTGAYTTYDGGAFYGSAVGIGGGGILDGIAKLLYIDPSGNAGVASSVIEGLYGSGAYIAAGDITGDQKVSDIGIPAGDLYSSIFRTNNDNGMLYGVANSGGSSTGTITGNDSFNTFSIVNNETGKAEQWGIYQHIFWNSSYSGDLSSGWTGHAGGNDAIGAYYRIYGSDGRETKFMDIGEGGQGGRFNNDYGYWLMEVTSGAWADNNFTAGASGFFMTMTKAGTISGDIIGVYNDEGSWQGAGIGEWEGVPLKFMSEISGYFTEWGNRNGGMSAIMGGTGSLWTETPRLTMIGDYYLYAQTPQIWFADVCSQQFGNYGGGGERSFSFDGDGDGNGGSGSYTTYDGGAYYGIMGGVANGDSLTGRFLALYIDPDKNAGILSSDLSGTMYPGLSMFEVTGDVTRGFKSVVGVDPKDLYDSVYETYGNEGRIYGTFADDAGYIYGDDYGEFGTASIVDYNNMVAQNWGIYAQHIYGEYEGGTAPTWTAMLGGYDAFGATQPYYSHDEGYWIARINDGTMTQNLDGEGFFGGTGTVRGSVNGTFITHFKMGTISGNLDGIYWEDWDGGYWEGLNLGTWIGQALSFVSDFGMRSGGDYYGAIAGGTDSLWQTAPGGITIIGNMGQGDSSPAHTWSSYGPVISHDYTMNTDTTYDGGAYYGYMGGSASGDVMRGAFGAIYIDPAGNAGILWSDLSGTLYGDIGIFGMFDQQVVKTQYALSSEVGVGPQDLVLSRNDNYSQINGVFSGSSGTISGLDYMPNYSIIGSDGDGYLTQGWGIYTQSINGSYTSATWAFTAREGGSGDFGFRLSGETFASDTGYWIADIDAVFNTDRTIDAGVSGTFLTPTKLGDISGQLMGAFHPDPQVAGSGTWEAAGIGVWASEALSFVSSIVPAIKSLTVTEVTVNLIDGWGEKIGAKGGVETLIEYTYYSDFSQGYRKEYGYEYDKNGNFKGYKQGSYEATYYPDGHYEMTKYTKKDGWVDETGTWTYNDIKNIGVINQPMTTSGETQEFVTASGSLSVSDAGSAFFTSLAGGTGPISWGGTSPITLIGALNSTGAAGNAWKAELYSYDYINSTNTTYQGGAYYGYLLGPKSGSLRSLFVALYVDPADGLGVSRSGYLFGKLDGTVYSDLNMVKATGDITATIMDLDCGITAAGLYSAAKSTDTFTWGGMAPFGVDGTGSLRGYSSGDMLGLSGENWGIWTAFIGGNYEKPAPGPTGPAPITEWSLPFGGISAGGAYMLGKIAGGAWSETDQAFSGDLSSLYFIRGAGDSVRAGVIEGAVEGNYIEIDETTGTWNAAAAGEWVEVTDLLDQTKMFGPEGLTVLDRLLSSSVPITEVYSNMLTGSGSIAGGVTVTNLADFLNFSFTNWADYKWIADYAGRTNGIDITGQAGGTYSVPDVNGSGTFVGVGAGANETVINTVNVAGNYGPAGTIPNMTADVNLYEAPEAAPN